MNFTTFETIIVFSSIASIIVGTTITWKLTDIYKNQSKIIELLKKEKNSPKDE